MVESSPVQELLEKARKHVRIMAPHVRKRATAQLMVELIEALEGEDAACDDEEDGHQETLRLLDESNKRMTVLEQAIREHRAQKADDRCWEDDQKLYAALGDGDLGDNTTCDPCVMLENCKKFILHRMEGGSWPSYQQLQQEVTLLKAQVQLVTSDSALFDMADIAVRALRDGWQGEAWFEDCDNQEPGELILAAWRGTDPDGPALTIPPEKPADPPADEAPLHRTGGGSDTLLKVGGKPFRCDCGCNVFRKLEPPPFLRYECNSCHARYTGQPLEDTDTSGRTPPFGEFHDEG